jgi:hypothetical protein
MAGSELVSPASHHEGLLEESCVQQSFSPTQILKGSHFLRQ